MDKPRAFWALKSIDSICVQLSVFCAVCLHSPYLMALRVERRNHLKLIIATAICLQLTVIRVSTLCASGIFVNRREAIGLIEEINQECESIRGTSIMLKLPEETDILSKGYQVHLIMKATRQKLHCLEVVAGQYGYVVKSDPERWLVMIYRPEHGEVKTSGHGMA